MQCYHSQPTGASTPLFDDTSKFVPYIHSQLQDWEEGLSENEADGSFLHENWNNDLKLFSGSEDGGHQLIQLLMLRAEGETKAISGENITDFLKTDLCKNSNEYTIWQSEYRKVFID